MRNVNRYGFLMAESKETRRKSEGGGGKELL